MTMRLIRAQDGNFSGAGAVLFLNELCSDVSIIVECEGSEVRYPAHSLFLVSMSRVFRTMLQSDLEESSTGRITIKDSNPFTVKQFLRFLYFGGVDLADWHDALDVLMVAHKYEIDILVSLCEKHLIGCLSIANVCYLHDMAEMYSLQSLIPECRRLIVDAAFIVLKTESFESMCHNSAVYFFSHRCLNVENESFVLDSLRLWSAAQCCLECKEVTADNTLAIMTPLLRHINFNKVPDCRKSFLPESVRVAHRNNRVRRVNFSFPATLHKHMTTVKFNVELGCFANMIPFSESSLMLKFSVDDGAYLVGFRIVCMFPANSDFETSSPLLVLCKEDSGNVCVSFNLSSVHWRCGAVVGDYVWKETSAYFPQPTKLVINSTYCLILRSANALAANLPKTRLETKEIMTVLGKMNFFCFGSCGGITELFLLPAPPHRETVDQP